MSFAHAKHMCISMLAHVACARRVQYAQAAHACAHAQATRTYIQYFCDVTRFCCVSSAPCRDGVCHTGAGPSRGKGSEYTILKL